MDTTWTLLLPLSILLPLITLWIFSLRESTSKRKKYKLPPSPPTIPLIGGLLSLRVTLSEIVPTLHRLRAIYGPIVTFDLGIFPVIFVFDHRLAYEALVQKGGTFSHRKPLHPSGAAAIHASKGHTISLGNGAIWRLLRRNLASTILHPSHVRSFSQRRRCALRRLQEDLLLQSKSGEGVVLVFEAFRQAIFQILLEMCFGEDVDERKVRDIERVQRNLMLMAWKLNVFDLVPLSKILLWRRWREFLRIRREQEAIMIPLIAARRDAKDKRGDLCYVDTLIGLQLPDEGGRCPNDDEIVSMCSELLNAGTDSTVAAIEWIMAEIVRHPHVQNRPMEEVSMFAPLGKDVDEDALKKMPYLKAVVLEGLRRHPPAPFLLPHVVWEDVSLDGYDIPKGSTVNFGVAELGWDGEQWEEPFEFRPERFLGKDVDITGGKEIKMMPFGAGRRICPGLGIAMLHLEYFVACLVRDFEWEAEDGREVDLSETIEFTMVMKNPLRARIRPRGVATHA